MGYSKKPVFRSVTDFKGRSVAVYMEKIAEQDQLLRIVRAALPPSIAEHANYCVVSGGRLLIYTDSAIWASQIRFFEKAILNKLSEDGQHKISSFKVKIQFPFRDAATDRKACLPSSETVQSMLGSMDEKSEDVLDKALVKLAKTLKKCLEN